MNLYWPIGDNSLAAEEYCISMGSSEEQGKPDSKYVGPEAMRFALLRRLASKGPPLPLEEILQARRWDDGQEKAERVNLGVVWDMGAPIPTVIQSEFEAFLLFFLSSRDPSFNGKTIHVRSPLDRGVAIVRFERCMGAHLGPPSEETLAGHPLWGRGLDFYDAFIVRNSRWLAQLEQIDSVHPHYDAEWWSEFNHYILTFHDTTFQCIAQRYEVSRIQGSLRDAATEVLRRLTG